MSAALDLLTRTDKWYLSAGEGLLWAPPFPVWLDAPGFWDEARVLEYALQPVFSVAFVDEAGREIPLSAQRRRWTPAALEVPYAPAQGLELVETRMVLPGFVLGSEWQIVNVGVARVRLHAIAWTTAPGEDVEPGDVAFSDSELTWSRVLKAEDGPPLAVRLQLAMARGADSWGAIRSERAEDQPHFALTPFWDRWDALHGGLRSAEELGTGAPRGQIHLGIHRAMDIEPGAAARVAIALRAVPELTRSAERDEEPAPRRASSFHAASRASWASWFDALPTFRCSDPYFERYWAYRWYGLRLNAIASGLGNYGVGAVTEGVGPRHRASAEGAVAHARELRWMRDPEPARAELALFVAHQRADGSFPEWIGAASTSQAAARRIDWGTALLALDQVHPSDAFLKNVLPAFERHAAFLLAADGETAHSVEAAVCAHQLCRAIETLAARGAVDAAIWRTRAEATGAALLKKMWDARSAMFVDVNAVSGRRGGARSAMLFAPYATDLIGAPHLAGLVQNLFDPRQFWKPFPVSSLSGTDPRYDPDGALDGRRIARPMNGRVWPVVNSRIADVIARVAIHHVPALRAHLAEFVTKFVRMMFWDGDAARPNGFEHYHPVSGRPSAYRGLDDQQVAWVNDLIVQYVIGLRSDGEGRCLVDPMPFGLDGFEAAGLPMQGRAIDVVREAELVKVRVDGREAARGRLGEPIAVRL